MDANEISWQARQDARTEARLRELMSDLAYDVARGERTHEEAMEIYLSASHRWMHES